MIKTLTAKHTTGRNGKPVITIDHICGDHAEFTVNQLLRLATTLIAIAEDVSYNRLGAGKTKEYDI